MSENKKSENKEVVLTARTIVVTEPYTINMEVGDKYTVMVNENGEVFEYNDGVEVTVDEKDFNSYFHSAEENYEEDSTAVTWESGE